MVCMHARTIVPLTGLALLLGACGDPAAAPTAPARADHAGMHTDLSASATCGTVNLAEGRVATASSVEGNFIARSAVDGDPTTRWSSLARDPEWIQVNLGSVQPICGLTLRWEAAYGKAFKIEVSNDATVWTPIYSTTGGAGGTQTITPTASASGQYVSGQYVRLTGTQRGTGYGYSLWEMQVFGAPGSGTPPTDGWVMAPNPVTGVSPSMADPPHRYFHEFQANCAVSRTNLPDDPIVYFGRPGASHSHTFLGNTTTNASTTLASLQAGSSACSAPDDRSAYWMPTMLNGDTPVQPVGPQVIYYKTGVTDYTSVRPFPAGLRFVVGNMMATPDEFLAGSYEGWECGNSYHMSDFPSRCPAGTALNVRYQAPSCWDGLHLDSPDHKSHMAYPVNGRCTTAHPVAVPMLEFKMAFPTGDGDTGKFRLASGRGYSFHYDFFNAWDPATLKAMVDHCIVGGFQCNARGYDETHPEAGAALGTDYRLH